MELYVVLGVLVVLATLYLWRARAEDAPSTDLPPGLRSKSDDVDPRSGDRSETNRSARTDQTSEIATKVRPSAPADDDLADPIQAAIARLVKEPSYRNDADHPDCQKLIQAGVTSVHALYAAVQSHADWWVSLHAAMASVADGLGNEGRAAVADLLAQAADQHHGRMVSFLNFATSTMSAELCPLLCARVTPDTASALGEAAAHRGREGFLRVAEQLIAAPTEKAPALEQMLAALFSSTSFADLDTWKQALSHKHPRVRKAATLAIADRANQRDLLRIAADPDADVRHALIVGAEELPIDLLLRLTEDPSPRVRAYATWKLRDESPAVVQAYRRRLDDPSPAVALMAALGLDDVDEAQGEMPAAGPPFAQRLEAALLSHDPLLREVASQIAGFLPAPAFCRSVRELYRTGAVDAVAAAIGCAEDDPDVLACIAELMRSDPPLRVLRAGEVQLAFSDEAAASASAASLLDHTLPARVRRAGFYSIAPHRAAWSTHVQPLLHPDEPLLADLINELDCALIADEPVDHAMFERLKRRFPDTAIAELADTALART